MPQSDADQFLAQLEAAYADLLVALQDLNDKNVILQNTNSNMASAISARDAANSALETYFADIIEFNRKIAELQTAMNARATDEPHLRAAVVNADNFISNMSNEAATALAAVSTAESVVANAKANVETLKARVIAEVTGDFPTA